ncbi:hypothetical protein FA13DRAFT_1808124 [Coprinellus micaceus]|uniref:Zn(2)-C6 fungal-type domain-containing protein n=1 Tax=Coprinellus micaceus TaxID=71717 RepID=A0A4Y7U117_COPMI|nr:hypothetical protein FA13DRAFT_1808124 [Coprinellus micaceus]
MPSAPSPLGPRVTVVCAECKRLKLKCDRQSPCNQCGGKANPDRCLYSATGVAPPQTLAQRAADQAEAAAAVQHLSGTAASLSAYTSSSATLRTIGSMQDASTLPPLPLRELPPVPISAPEASSSASPAGTQSRVVSVCLECRRLKLRCDRGSPCSSCASS